LCYVGLRSTKWVAAGEEPSEQILGDGYFWHNYIAFSKENQTIGIAG